MTIINESGLYSLILSSKLPQADVVIWSRSFWSKSISDMITIENTQECIAFPNSTPIHVNKKKPILS